MKTRYRTAPALAVIAAALALGLFAAFSIARPLTSHAQAANPSYITIQTSQTQVHEGGLATFTLKRTGGSYTNSLTVQVKTWETNHLLPDNATEQFHDVTFGRRDNVATLDVLVYKDQEVDVGAPELKAQVQAPSDSSYTVGTPDTAAVGVIHVGYSLPAGVTNIGITVDDPEINEGGSVTFTVTRSGETTQPVTVDLEVDDPSGVLRGNHWDPPPDLPTQVEFGANETSHTLVITAPEDQHDSPKDSFKLMVLPSHDYVIVGLLYLDAGYELSRSVKVIDNDTPQELELNFGKDSVNDVDVNEGDTLGVVVKRRQQDADNGTTATFTVRLETDRAGDDNILDGLDRGHLHRAALQGLPSRHHRLRPAGDRDIHRLRERRIRSQLGLLGFHQAPDRPPGNGPGRRRRGQILDRQVRFPGDNGRRHRQRGQQRHGPVDG